MSQDPLAKTFEEAFTPTHIDNLFQRLVESKRDLLDDHVHIPPGWDRKSLDAFQKQRHQHIAAVSRKVLGGRYTFRPFIYRDVPKAGGGCRKISFSGIRDRVAQAGLHQVIQPVVDALLSDSAYAYRQGIGTHDAIEAIYNAATSGKPWVFESDFEKFFDTLDHTRLKDLIDGLPLDPRAKVLCWRFVRTGELRAESKERPVPRSRSIGVPQGGVLSGVLANLYLVEFDETLRAAGNTLVRYADDFLMLCPSPAECAKSHQLAAAKAEELHLTLHPGKTTEQRSINKGIEFVGFRLRGTLVSVKPANVARFKSRISGILRTLDGRIEAGEFGSRREAVSAAIQWVNRKIQGVSIDGTPRSWIRYFRVVNDEKQIRDLDSWVWRQLQRWVQVGRGPHLTRSELRQRGLTSLVSEYWNARRTLRTKSLPSTGFV